MTGLSKTGLTTAQAAEMARVHEPTIVGWARRGLIASLPKAKGGRGNIRLFDLKALIETMLIAELQRHGLEQGDVMMLLRHKGTLDEAFAESGARFVTIYREDGYWSVLFYGGSHGDVAEMHKHLSAARVLGPNGELSKVLRPVGVLVLDLQQFRVSAAKALEGFGRELPALAEGSLDPRMTLEDIDAYVEKHLSDEAEDT